MQDNDNRSEDSESANSLNSSSDYEDDDDTIPIEKSITDAPSQTTQQEELPISPQILSDRVHKSYELIYIAAYSPIHRQRIEELAILHNCEIFFVKSSYTITFKDPSKSEQFDACKAQIHGYINRIIYKKIQEKEKPFRLVNSPQINKYASQMGIYICLFNRQIYLHTSELSEKELDEKSKTILQYYNIYSVCYNKKRSFETIDVEIAKFFTIAVDEYYREKFTTAGVIVELSKNQRSFYILGKPGTPASVMMQAKTTLKNLIEGLTVVVFKNTVLQSKEQLKLKEYLKKVSKFPITHGKLSQNVCAVISKDNILRELLKKQQKLIKKMGINESTQMGIYIPYCYSRLEKKEQIHKICKQMGYDYWNIRKIKYFRQMIASEGDVNDQSKIMELLELITRIVGGFGEVKDKYEIMKAKKEPENKITNKLKKQLEEQGKYAYVLMNSSVDSKELSKALRRDVMEEEVLMKKRYNVIYQLMETKQIGPFYIEKAQYDKGVEKGQIKLIEEKDLKKGDYFETYLKISDKFFERPTMPELQELLVEEMKKLKDAARNDKAEGKGLDNERRIAHMIRKMVKIF